MTKEEIEAWLEHVPVFGVTDAQGQGVILRPDNDTSVLYFFISPIMANNTMNQLKANAPEMDLRVSAFSLGKIWFSMLNAGDDKEVIVSLQSWFELLIPSILIFLVFVLAEVTRQ